MHLSGQCEHNLCPETLMTEDPVNKTASRAPARRMTSLLGRAGRELSA